MGAIASQPRKCQGPADISGSDPQGDAFPGQHLNPRVGHGRSRSTLSIGVRISHSEIAANLLID